MAPSGYDSIGGASDVFDWIPGHWDLPSPEDATIGDEIRLSESPQWGLTLQTNFFSASWPQVVVQQSGLHKWIKKLDGSIALAAKPSLVLAVEGDLGSGNARIVVAREGAIPPHTAMWKLDSDGRIRLEHSQELGLSVAYGKFEAGAAVVLSNVSVLADHNKFRLNAISAGVPHSTPSKLRVVGSRGDPNTLWTSLTGAITYQEGYIAISQAYRDADSSWTYVIDNPHHPQIGTFIQEASSGGGFLLKLLEEKGSKSSKSSRYLSCVVESPSDDKRDQNSTWVYVTKKKSLASVFEEHRCPEGLVLKSNGSYLCCAKFKDRPTEFGSDYTWLYAVRDDSANMAAVLVVEPLPDSAAKQESWWKTSLRKYKKHIMCLLMLLALLVILAIIMASTQQLRGAYDEPMQILTPYDCNHQPEHMWSKTKVAWCCKHYAPLGCPAEVPEGPPVAPALPVAAAPAKSSDEDCFTDVLNWQRDWTIGKQNFCCETHGIACKAAMTTPAFNCDEDYHKWTERWSYQKKLWCCLHHERGCPASGPQAEATFDCAEADPQSWAQEKIEWCCYHASVACPGEKSAAYSGAKYDCDAGYTNWLHAWSEGKKVWCCFHSGRACSETNNDEEYDCDAGFANWQVGWSNSKMDFCCQTQQKGCAV